MKTLKKLMLGAVASVIGAAVVYAVGLSGTIINNPGITYNGRYVFNLIDADVNTLSTTLTYSSPTFTTQTFNAGQVSTATISIVSNTALSTAAAVTSITIVSTTGALGDSIVIPHVANGGATVLLNGRDWSYGPNTSSAAISMAAALSAAMPNFGFTVVGNVIFSSSPVGAIYNSVAVRTNNSTNITISSPTYLGGRDSAVIYVNGTAFKANKDFPVAGSAAATATNLATAINANTWLAARLTATAAGPGVNIQSDAAGSLYNFPIVNSNIAASSVTPTSGMYGGITPSYTLNSGVINIPNHGFVPALAVVYSSGSAKDTIGGLTNQTTYYVVVIDANNIGLSSTSAVAQTGVYINLTSTLTLTTNETFTLRASNFNAGGASFGWETSNDGLSWTAIAASTVTYTSPGSTSFNLTGLSSTYLGLHVIGPTTGAINLQVTANGQYLY